MLDNIYEPFELDDGIREDLRGYLDKLYPFCTYEEGEEEFFEQFDGVEVLPAELFEEFKQYIESKAYLDAEKMFVSISKQRYMQNKNIIAHVGIKGCKKIIPLIGLKYSQDLGLLDEKVDNIENKILYT
jgi:CRISPR-associated endonuclease/helicase Cas3